MRLLVLVAVLVLPSMAGIAQAQCRAIQCPPKQCPPTRCPPKRWQPVQHYPAIYQLPRVSHCQPIQSPAKCGSLPAVSMCNTVYAQPTYSVVAPTCGVTCPQSHIVYGHGATVILPGPIAGSLAGGDCNCGAVVQVYPQASAVVPGQGGAAGPRYPFSLSGQVHADTGKAVPSQCEIEFISCCAYGAKDCMAFYIACSDVTGEPLRHLLCPQVAPTIDE